MVQTLAKLNAQSLVPGLGASALPLAELGDQFGRIKRKLRVSLTDRCNFRCPYCMPQRPRFTARSDQLSRQELGRLLRAFVANLGIAQLRLTGGEPLLRVDLEDIVADCQALRPLGLERISLTSNGALLAGRAAALKAAGLDDLNVSLDALSPETFKVLSGGRALQPVLEGIAAAQAAGLGLKLNAVIVRDINEDEILPLARFAAERQLPLRFIEFMPLDGQGSWTRERVVSQAEILAHLRAGQAIEPLPRSHDPAAYFKLADASTVGIISTITQPFCANCDRLRITADGSLYTCLFSKTGTPLRPLLQRDEDGADLLARIRTAVWHKQAGYAEQPGYVERGIAMNTLGG